MRRFHAQCGEAADRFGGTAFGARLEQPAEQHQRDDRGHRFVVDVGGEARAQEDAGRGRRDEGIEIRGSCSNTNERIHVRRAVADSAPGALVELLAGPGDHRQRDRGEPPRDPAQLEDPALPRDPIPQPHRGGHEQPPHQVYLFHRAVLAHRAVGHQQHRADHRDDRDSGCRHELPGQRADLTAARDALPLERILRRDRRRHLEARGSDRLLEILGTHDPGDVVDGFAHRLDQLRDVGLRGIVLDGGFVRGEIDARGRDAGGTGQRLLHRGSAARARHAFDRQDDPGLTHGWRRGTCAATMRRGARPAALRPADPSACSCRSGTGIRQAGRE